MQEAAYVVSRGVQDRGVAMMLPKAMSARHWTIQCRALWPGFAAQAIRLLAACKTLGKPAEAAESALFGLPDERTRL